MFTFGVGFAANGFAIGDLGRLEREVDVVALVQLGDDDLDVLLARAGQQKLFCLRIARKAQCWIFFHDLVNAHADFVFIGARLGLDGKGDGRFGKLRGRIVDRRVFVAERFTRGGFLQLGDGADVACVQFVDFRELLALHYLRVLKAFRQAAVVVHQRGVILQHAAFYFEIVDSSRKGIGKSLEDEKRKRLAIVVFPLDAVTLAFGLFEADLRVLIGMREDIGDER